MRRTLHLVRLDLRRDQQLVSIGIYGALRVRKVQVQTIRATVSSIWVFRMDLFEAAGEVSGGNKGQNPFKAPPPVPPFADFRPVEL